MENAIVFIKDILDKTASRNNLFKRNKIKEYLQVLVLDYIYSHKEYSGLIFYGGSCISHCFGLPRLSEDLDFVDVKSEFDVHHLARELKSYFSGSFGLAVTTAVQKFRIYLKFPILRALEMAEKGETDFLFLKVEIYRGFGFCKNFEIVTVPLFKMNKSILIKTFDMSTLMSTKIRAVLYRKWEKTDKSGKTLAVVKGRDYFDLMWYLEKGIKPNLSCIENIKDEADMKKILTEIIEKIDTKSIQYDLEAFVDNKEYVKRLSVELKDIIKRKL